MSGVEQAGELRRELGQRLKAERLRLGMSQRQLAFLYLAQLHKFFATEGLHVKITPIVSSTTAISGQLHGEFDVTAGAYVSYILAEAKNPSEVSWRILTEGSVSQSGSQAVLVTSGSPIRTVADLKGKTIAANIVGNVGTLLIQAMLQAHGVPLSSVKLVAIPFPRWPPP